MAERKALVVILLFVLAAAICSANDFYNVSYSCPFGCITNRVAVWNISISNLGQSERGILQVSIVDAVSKKTIGSTPKSNDTEEIVMYPSLSFDNESRGGIVKLKYENQYVYNISARLPSPNYGLSLLYNLCVIRTVPKYSWYKLGKETYYCYTPNLTMPLFGCVENVECADDEQCMNNLCAKPNCTESQFAFNHSCNNYECMSNSNCSMNMRCTDHKCEEISCEGVINEGNVSFNVFLANHSCSKEPCLNSRIIANYTCLDADCAYDEHIQNYSCQKLGCRFDEAIVNHSCTKLLCREGEGIINHSCMVMECTSQEAIINYSCQNLVCMFYQKAENHSCLFNSDFIIKAALFVLVASLFVIDFKRYKGIRRKKLVEMLLKKAKKRSDGTKGEN